MVCAESNYRVLHRNGDHGTSYTDYCNTYSGIHLQSFDIIQNFSKTWYSCHKIQSGVQDSSLHSSRRHRYNADQRLGSFQSHKKKPHYSLCSRPRRACWPKHTLIHQSQAQEKSIFKIKQNSAHH